MRAKKSFLTSSRCTGLRSLPVIIATRVADSTMRCSAGRKKRTAWVAIGRGKHMLPASTAKLDPSLSRVAEAATVTRLGGLTHLSSPSASRTKTNGCFNRLNLASASCSGTSRRSSARSTSRGSGLSNSWRSATIESAKRRSQIGRRTCGRAYCSSSASKTSSRRKASDLTSL